MFLRTMTSKKVLVDGCYDSRDSFRQLDEMKVIPVIKVRKNHRLRTTPNVFHENYP